MIEIWILFATDCEQFRLQYHRAFILCIGMFANAINAIDTKCNDVLLIGLVGSFKHHLPPELISPVLRVRCCSVRFLIHYACMCSCIWLARTGNCCILLLSDGLHFGCALFIWWVFYFIIPPPPHNEVVGGVYWFHSVRPFVRPASRVRSVVPTVLVGSISYLPILSSNFRRCHV